MTMTIKKGIAPRFELERVGVSRSKCLFEHVQNLNFDLLELTLTLKPVIITFFSFEIKIREYFYPR